MDPCPRCGLENVPRARACARCRTPLAFGEEPAPRPLDRELDLDRRGRERALAGPEDPAGPAGVVSVAMADEAPFDPDRSDWRIGAASEGEPVPEEQADEDPADEDQADDAEAAEEGEALLPASPARRVTAWAIDGALVAAAAFAVPALLLASSGGIPAAGAHPSAFGYPLWLILPAEGFVGVVTFVYATVAHALAGATLGKRIARIRVVEADGRPPGLACSAARSAWAVVSLALAGAGMVPALVGPSGRALHDLLAGTRVVEAP